MIADAGPLIHLDELERLFVLEDFGQVIVPGAVWEEVERHRPQALTVEFLTRQRVVANLDRIAALATLYTLHRGEKEALSLCIDRPDTLLLTDDTAARLAANSIHVEARGTLGLLLRAWRRSKQTREETLQSLRAVPEQTSLHIRPSLLKEIIRQVEAESG